MSGIKKWDEVNGVDESPGHLMGNGSAILRDIRCWATASLSPACRISCRGYARC